MRNKHQWDRQKLRGLEKALGLCHFARYSLLNQMKLFLE